MSDRKCTPYYPLEAVRLSYEEGKARASIRAQLETPDAAGYIRFGRAVRREGFLIETRASGRCYIAESAGKVRPGYAL